MVQLFAPNAFKIPIIWVRSKIKTSKATTPNQQTKVFSFQDIEQNKLPSFDYVPTLIIVGHVVNLHQKFAWLQESNTSNSYFDNHKTTIPHAS